MSFPIVINARLIIFVWLLASAMAMMGLLAIAGNAAARLGGLDGFQLSGFAFCILHFVFRLTDAAPPKWLLDWPVASRGMQNANRKMQNAKYKT